MKPHPWLIAYGKIAINDYFLFIIFAVLIWLFPAGWARADNLYANPKNISIVLGQAEPGDVVLAAPGKYDELLLRNVSGSAFNRIIIKSEKSSSPAEFKKLTLYNTRGILLDDLIFEYSLSPDDTMEAAKVSQILDSDYVTIARTYFRGDTGRNTGSAADGYGTLVGLFLRSSSNITIIDSKFDNWYRGISIRESSNLHLRNNEFFNLRSDGVTFAAVENSLIENNSFHSFSRSPSDKSHPDMIQFWTNGTSYPSQNITIRNNILNSSMGAWTQSIFMRNEAVDSQGAGLDMYYKNIVITGNVLINSHLNGVTVGETNGLDISHNTIVYNRFSTLTDGNIKKHTPAINVAGNSSNVRIERNIVGDINGPTENKSWITTNNLVIQNYAPSQPGFYDKVFSSASYGLPKGLSPFMYLPDGPAGNGDLGSPLLSPKYQDKNGAPPPMVRVARSNRYRNVIEFSLESSDFGLEKSVNWSFGDGRSSKQHSVAHSYDVAGSYTVHLSIEGLNEAFQFNVRIPDPIIIEYDGTNLERPSRQDIKPKRAASFLAPGRLGFIPIIQGPGVTTVPKSSISEIFGANDIFIDLRFRTVSNITPYGELLQVHRNFALALTPLGGIRLSLRTDNNLDPVIVSTPPLKLHDGEWHNIGLSYSSESGHIYLYVDGKLMGNGISSGQLRPAESWGLSFGNPWEDEGLSGELSYIKIKVGPDTFSAIPKIR